MIGYRRAFLGIIILTTQAYGWIWECIKEQEFCKRRSSSSVSNYNNIEFYPSIEICRLICGNGGTIWPLPRNFTVNDRHLVKIDIKNLIYTVTTKSLSTSAFLENVVEYFKNIYPDISMACSSNVYQMHIKLKAKSAFVKLSWDTSEAYSCDVSTDEILTAASRFVDRNLKFAKTNELKHIENGKNSELKIIEKDHSKIIDVKIVGETVFGVRHGIESLVQMIESYNDNVENCFYTLKNYFIYDSPVYKHRGLLLDSARNFLSIETIKHNILAMAMSKMNVLHWHLTDTQSFPFVSRRVPNMSRYGAYSKGQIYEPNDIKKLLQFAKLHGVWIIPEIDGPSHTGNGWQWGPESGIGNLIVCHNQQPWRSFCIQPPCGQMNPANPWLYTILGNLYKDILDLWVDSDTFHMGGDEVFIPCWNSSEEILKYIGIQNRSEEAFLNLWSEFQVKALKAFDSARGNNQSYIILWTSSLTQPKLIGRFLSKDRYVIQTWVPKSDNLPDELIKLGYKLIISTKDRWYLDHGFWGTTSFYNWRKVYENNILMNSAVLGGEVCMWGELVDDNNIESTIWPRAAAAAERLWSNPKTSAVAAENRFFIHNERLHKRGIKAAPVTPKYCSQSEGDCDRYLSYYFEN